MHGAGWSAGAIWPTVSSQPHRSPASSDLKSLIFPLKTFWTRLPMIPLDNMLHRLSVWILLAFLTTFTMRTLLMIDINKRVYNHAPGPCRYIPNIENGAAGFHLSSGGVFLSLGAAHPARKGVTPQIALFDITNTQNYAWEKLGIEGDSFETERFSPRHLTAYESKGRLSLYVVNGFPGNEGVELFVYAKEKKALLHRKSLQDPQLNTVSSVLSIGPDRLFLTNLAYFSKDFLKTIELLFQSSFGSLLLYDGKEVKQLDSRVPSPSSLAYDQKKRILYVGSLLNELVRAYKVKQDLSVEFLHDIPLLSSPSGLYVEPATGDLWVSLHPVLYQAVIHSKDPSTVSPSQILRVRMQEGGKSWVITEPYANDGASVSASSAVLFHKERLLIGGLYGKALLCDTNKDQIT